jgi:hypothetical protein
VKLTSATLIRLTCCISRVLCSEEKQLIRQLFTSSKHSNVIRQQTTLIIIPLTTCENKVSYSDPTYNSSCVGFLKSLLFIPHFTATKIQTMQFHQAILSLFFLVGASSTVEYASAFAPSRLNTLSSSTRLNSQTGDIESPALSDNVNATANSIDGITISPGEATQRLGISTGPTVWSEFGRIAQEFEPVNLGQGFPDWLPPKFAVDSLVEAVLDSAKSPHQYTRPAGHPDLVKQLAQRYSIHMKRDIEPMAEVAVTVGASQALYISLQTLVKPGEFLFSPAKIGSLTRGACL